MTHPQLPFLDIPLNTIRFVVDLNSLMTLPPCQAFGHHMTDRGDRIILNMSSMSDFWLLTKIPGYSTAKTVTSNFAQWLLSNASRFITGIVISIDSGFSAYSGV